MTISSSPQPTRRSILEVAEALPQATRRAILDHEVAEEADLTVNKSHNGKGVLVATRAVSLANPRLNRVPNTPTIHPELRELGRRAHAEFYLATFSILLTSNLGA